MEIRTKSRDIGGTESSVSHDDPHDRSFLSYPANIIMPSFGRSEKIPGEEGAESKDVDNEHATSSIEDAEVDVEVECACQLDFQSVSLLLFGFC